MATPAKLLALEPPVTASVESLKTPEVANNDCSVRPVLTTGSSVMAVKVMLDVVRTGASFTAVTVMSSVLVDPVFTVYVTCGSAPFQLVSGTKL